MLEAVLSNLHDMVNESAKKEIVSLKKTIRNQEAVIRKAKHIFSSIKIEAEKGCDLLKSCNVSDEFQQRISETPDLQALK